MDIPSFLRNAVISLMASLVVLRPASTICGDALTLTAKLETLHEPTANTPIWGRKALGRGTCRVPQCLAGLGNEMEARKLLDAAPFKADVIKALKQAFDEAWASIVHSIDPAAVENARLGLAHATIAHAGLLGTDDLAALKAAALASFEKNGTPAEPDEYCGLTRRGA
jgi:hypothetical protein